MPPSALRRPLRALAILSLALALAASVFVTVVAPSQASAQQMGTALSGAATADGASAYYNPAAMSAGEGTLLSLDLGFASLGAEFVPDTGLPPSTTSPIAPLLTLGGYTDLVHESVRLGLSVGIPKVIGASWDPEDGAGQITRYYLNEGAIVHMDVVPAVSWAPIPWLSVGLGANIVYGSITMDLDKDFGSELNMTVDPGCVVGVDCIFPYADPAFVAPVTAEGSGVGVGVIGGIWARPIDELSLGVSVHSPVAINATGSLSVEYPQALTDAVGGLLPGATLPDLNGEFEVDLGLPFQIFAGASVMPLPNLEVGLNYMFEQSSSQPNLNIIITEASSEAIGNTTKPQAYTNRHRVGFRVAYLPIEDLRVAVIGSVQTNTVPDLTVAPNNVDFDRFEVGFAARYRIVESFSVLLQYSHIFLADRTITTSLHKPLSRPEFVAFNHPSPTGRYTGAANTLRLGLALHL